jgi:importin subunit alpha-2
VSVELRKAKKDDQLSKRRNLNFDEDDDAVSPLKENNKQNVAPPMSMVEIIAGIQGSDAAIQFQATQQCRKLLSRERQPPIDDIIQSGIIPTLITFLDQSSK